MAMAAMVLALLAQGCLDTTTLEYEPLTHALDDRNELHVSTYPAGLPRQTSSIPFLYKALRTPDSLYFQVFVRDADRRSGPNPNIDSIRIESFSYRFPGQDPVELMADYDDYFWMQGSPRYDRSDSMPVRWGEGWYLELRIDLTVNGEHHLVEQRVDAGSRRRLYPLILYALE